MPYSRITEQDNSDTGRVFCFRAASLSFHFLPTALTAKGRPVGGAITLGSRNISKTYTSHDRKIHVSHIKHIYSVLVQKGVPNVDRLVASHEDHPRHGSIIFLQPRGVERQPRFVSEIIEAAICVLQALVVRLMTLAMRFGALTKVGQVMHAEPALFHRDIRWPNVLWSSQNKTWFLIDFDDASMAPTRAAPHLRRDSHHPGVFKDGHGAEVDIWAVGMLISNAAIGAVDSLWELSSIAEDMREGEMTAEQALIRLQSVKTSAK